MDKATLSFPAGAVPGNGYNFGTSAGVYTLAVLTILGLVMPLRTDDVPGGAGLISMPPCFLVISSGEADLLA